MRHRNVLTIPDAVGVGLIGPFAFSDPDETATLSVLFIGYRGFVQYQVDGVNVGAPVQVIVGQYGLSAPLRYFIPANERVGIHSVTATLLSVNGIPLQSSNGYLFIEFSNFFG